MAAPPQRFHPEHPKELERYLTPTESIVFMLRRHWLVLLEPIASAVGGFFLVLALDRLLAGGALRIRDIAIVAWIFLIGRMVWKVVDWHQELFLATDRRLMLLYGIFTRKVAMMPMAKVTDMRYDRTVPGKIFGYGVFILESAGQDQALNRINFIPNPDERYRDIQRVLFPPPQRRLSDKLLPASTGSRLPISEPEQAWWKR